MLVTCMNRERKACACKAHSHPAYTRPAPVLQVHAAWVVAHLTRRPACATALAPAAHSLVAMADAGSASMRAGLGGALHYGAASAREAALLPQLPSWEVEGLSSGVREAGGLGGGAGARGGTASRCAVLWGGRVWGHTHTHTHTHSWEVR